MQVSQESQAPEIFGIIVRKVIRDLFLEKKLAVPSVNPIAQRLPSLKVRHVLDLNLFFGIDIPNDDGKS